MIYLKKISTRRRFLKFFIYVALLFMVALLFWPIIWMISTAFKTDSNMFLNPPQWIPRPLTLDHFISFTEEKLIFKYFLNSILVLFVGIPASYAFSRFKFKGSRYMLLFFLTSQMIPWSLLVISLYIMFFKLNMINSYFGLILAHTTFTLPFIIWMMKGFFDSIPKELDEAAYVDGCSKTKTLLKIVMPLATSGVITAAIYAFLVSWNEFLFGLTLVSRNELRTLPPGIALSFIGEFQYKWGDMMATSLLVSTPIVILFIFLQNFLIKGLTAGAVKE